MNAPNSLVYYPAAMPPQICQAILDMSDKLVMEPARLAGGSRLDTEKRHTGKTVLPDDPAHAPVYEEIWRILEELNNKNWKFRLSGLEEMNVLTYDKEYFFGWHRDVVPREARIGTVFEDLPRKITLIVQLSEPHEYEGGDLEINLNELGDPEADDLADATDRSGEFIDRQAIRQRGTVIAFPAVFRHRVSPVRSGIRRSLVGWGVGPPDYYDNY